MEIKHDSFVIAGKRFYIEKDGLQVARAYLYIPFNDQHVRPFGFIEDVHVNEHWRGQGIGSQILHEVIDEAKGQHCYKIICTSRHSKPEVHKLYNGLGFTSHGLEFRMDLA